MRRALLLAGGFGTRLRPLTDTVPKCLVPICGKPLLEIWFDLVFGGGVERALVNTHWLGEAVEAHVAGSRWRDRVDLVHEPELLGTGGTIKANRAYFGNEAFMVAHADNLTDFDVRGLGRAHAGRPHGCAMTMLAFEADRPEQCGILELDAHQVVTAFHEKVANPPSNVANGAIYVFEPEIADRIDAMPGPFIDLSTEIIPLYMGRIFAHQTDCFLRDIGTPESLKKAEKEFPKQRKQYK